MSGITEVSQLSWNRDILSFATGMDPLKLDGDFTGKKIATANRDGNVQAVIEVMNGALVEAGNIEMNVETSLATRRDLGILAGSLIRVGVDPVSFDGFSSLSRDLATTADMSPFHTVFEYSVVNPKGDRERTFTDTPQERLFIEKVREGMDVFFDGALALAPVFAEDIDLKGDDVVCRFGVAKDCVERGIATIPQVIKHVGGRYFAQELRPYFDPLKIDGGSFDAPGGAQMPIMLIDHMLWASDSDDPNYAKFRDKNIIYMTPGVRRFILDSMGQPSLKSRSSQMSDVAAEELQLIIKRLYSFRAAHEVLARESFSHRNETALGSGGATPTLLTELKQLTHEQLS